MQRLAGGGGKVVERDRERDSQRRMQCQCVVEAARRTEHTHVIYHEKTEDEHHVTTAVLSFNI